MSASLAGPGYRTLLRLPGVPASYADAGTALACLGVTAALLAPVRGRWIDRQGVQRALPVLAASYSAVLLTIAYVASGRTSPLSPRFCARRTALTRSPKRRCSP
jgi:hypothetical protein